jgi:hypothetical protein
LNDCFALDVQRTCTLLSWTAAGVVVCRNRFTLSSVPSLTTIVSVVARPMQCCILQLNWLRFALSAAGAEADSFALGAWPDLRTAGGFRQISSPWVKNIAQLVCSCNADAAQQVRYGTTEGDNEATAAGSSGSSSSDRLRDMLGEAPDAGGARTGSGEAGGDAALADAQQQQQAARWSRNNSPPSYPSPCLLGSPFTTLAVTHNYHSLLHAEPREHPFSYIVWLDVLGAGSQMQVRVACMMRMWLQLVAFHLAPLPSAQSHCVTGRAFGRQRGADDQLAVENMAGDWRVSCVALVPFLRLHFEA